MKEEAGGRWKEEINLVVDLHTRFYVDRKID